jgi:enterochelin esterase-like enzyme
MLPVRLIRSAFAFFCVTTMLVAAPMPAQTPHVFFRVTLASSAPGPVSGRVLVFFKQGRGARQVDSEEFEPTGTAITAQNVDHLMPGASVEVDACEIAFPEPFCALPKGDYEAQAVLDPDGTYNYSGRGPEDWMSAVLAMPGWTPASPQTTLTLDSHPPDEMAGMQDRLSAMTQQFHVKKEEFVSPMLTNFWGRPTSIRAWVALPPGYEDHAAEHYPTVYWTAGFGGSFERNVGTAFRIRQRMEAGAMPPMIWVFLDEHLPEGTHEFADSVNNGPWGAALTREFIPMLEAKYRMDAKPTGRFTQGHSSGGWATLQLQVNYPDVFGGAWATSPDPSDFHNFTGPDLYAAHANVYLEPGGNGDWPIMRDKGKVVATLKQFAQMEAVIGPYGGQLSSFEWVFSPKGRSGAPEEMFDRVSGDVNPVVVQYWHDHYDLAHVIEATWAQRGPMLKGRIHLYVGTSDTFYLNESAKLFEARLNALGAEPHFTYIPGRTHFDLYNGVFADGKTDRNALFDTIAQQMYAVARPGSDFKPKPMTAPPAPAR